VLARIRQRLTFANVVSLLALFVALGGGSYAAFKISGSQLENRSVSGKKLKRNTLGGAVINESRLGKVRRARHADFLGGLRASQLRLRCPRSTIFVSGTCVETQARPAGVYAVARAECADDGRRLPTYEERANSVLTLPLAAPNGELTSSVFTVGSNGELRIVTVVDNLGHAGTVGDKPDGARPYRCVAYPSN
jgi:hypothetical protein